MFYSELENSLMAPQVAVELGGWNMVKDWAKASARILVVFPTQSVTKEVSLSHTSIYTIIKKQFGDEVFVDICFAPPMYQFKSYSARYPLLLGALSKRSWQDFDVIGLSISVMWIETIEFYKMALQSGFPLHHKDRMDDGVTPLLVTGGVSADISAGLDNITDIYAFGYGERLFQRLLTEVIKLKSQYSNIHAHKQELIWALKDYTGFCYPAAYHESWQIKDGRVICDGYTVDDGFPQTVSFDTMIPISKYGHLYDAPPWWSMPGYLRKSQVFSSMGCSGAGSCNFCVQWDTIVPTNHGLKYAEDVSVADKVVTVDGKFAPVTAFYRYKKPVMYATFGIKEAYGYSIHATPDHKIMVWDDVSKEVTWRELERVSFGTYCIFRRGFHSVEDKLGTSAVFAEVLGWIVATPRRVLEETSNIRFKVVCYKDRDKEHFTEVVEYFNDMLSHMARIEPPIFMGKGLYELSIVFKTTDHYHTFLDYCGLSIDDYGCVLRIPSRVWKMDEAAVKAFIRGVFDTAGTVSKDARISVSFILNFLRKDFQILLLSMSIRTVIVSGDMSSVLGYDKFAGDLVLQLVIEGEDSYRVFDHIRFAAGRKKDRYNRYIVPKYKLASDDINEVNGWSDTFMLQLIYSSYIDGTADVIDITVGDDSHSFIANGLVVHNCHESSIGGVFQERSYEELNKALYLHKKRLMADSSCFHSYNCVTGDTLVSLSTGGLVRAQNLVPSVSLMTPGGKAQSFDIHSTSADELVRITTVPGYRFEGTPRHRHIVYSFERDAVEERYLGDICEGDWVVLSRSDSGLKVCKDNSFAWLCGYFLGFGRYAGNLYSAYVSVHQDNEDVRDRLEAVCAELDITYTKSWISTRKFARKLWVYRLTSPLYCGLLYSYTMVDEMCPGVRHRTNHVFGSGNARYPAPYLKDEIFTYFSRDDLLSFFRGWFDAAGGYEIPKYSENYGVIFLTSRYERVIREAQTVLLSLGMVSSIHSKSVKLKIGKSVSWRLHLAGAMSYKVFARYVGFTSKFDQRLIEEHQGNFLGIDHEVFVPCHIREVVKLFVDKHYPYILPPKVRDLLHKSNASLYSKSGRIGKFRRGLTYFNIATWMASPKFRQVAVKHTEFYKAYVSGLFICEVKSVERLLGSYQVYDICDVGGGGLWFGNGFLTHNSNFLTNFPDLMRDTYKYFNKLSVINFRVSGLANSIRLGGTENNYVSLVRTLDTKTLACPTEGINQRMRDFLNKNLSFEDIKLVMTEAFRNRFLLCKIGMIRSAYERKSDIEDMAREWKEILDIRDSMGAGTGIRINLCLAKDQRVHTARGYVKSQELSPFDLIYDGRRYRPVLAVSKHPAEPVYRVVTVDGYGITANAKHPLQVAGEDGPKFVQIKYLRRGDFVFLERGPAEPFLQQISYYQLDITDEKYRCFRTLEVTPEAAKFLACVSVMRVDESGNGYLRDGGVTVRAEVREACGKYTSVNVMLSSALIAVYCNSFIKYVLGYIGSKPDAVLDIIMRSPSDVVKAYLQMLIMLCGKCDISSSAGYVRSIKVYADMAMLRGVQILLLRFNIITSIFNPYGESFLAIEKWYTAIFFDSIGFPDGFYDLSPDQMLVLYHDSDLGDRGKDHYSVIRSVEELPEEPVYGCQVSGGVYSVNGFITHNTSLIHERGTPCEMLPRVVSYRTWMSSIDQGYYSYDFLKLSDMGIRIKVSNELYNVYMQQLQADLPAELVEEGILQTSVGVDKMTASHGALCNKYMADKGIDLKRQFINYDYTQGVHQYIKASPSEELFKKKGLAWFKESHPICLKMVDNYVEENKVPGCYGCSACGTVNDAYVSEGEALPAISSDTPSKSFKDWLKNREVQHVFNLMDIRDMKLQSDPSFFYQMVFFIGPGARYVAKEGMVRGWLSALAEADERWVLGFRRIFWGGFKLMDNEGFSSAYEGYEIVNIGTSIIFDAEADAAVAAANAKCPNIKLVRYFQIYDAIRSAGSLKYLVELKFNIPIEEIKQRVIPQCFATGIQYIYKQMPGMKIKEIRCDISYKLAPTKDGYLIYLLMPPRFSPVLSLMATYSYTAVVQKLVWCKVKGVLSAIKGSTSYEDIIHNRIVSDLNGFITVKGLGIDEGDDVDDDDAPELVGG